jgi:hypothetical protein
MPTGSAFNGPLKHFPHTGLPFGVNSPGGTTTTLAKSPFLIGCSLEAVDALQILPYGTSDDTPRTFGWAWGGCSFPGSYAAGTTEGLTTAVTGSIAHNNALGGGILSTTGAAGQNSIFGVTSMQVVAGKRIWFNVRVTTSVTATEAVTIGLADAVPADVSAGLPVNGIFFQKATAGTDYSFQVRKAGTSTTVSAGVLASAGITGGLVAATFNDFGFLVDASQTAGGTNFAGAISCYVDGRFAGSVNSTDANIPTVVLGPLYANKASAGTPTMTIQQALCVQEQ